MADLIFIFILAFILILLTLVLPFIRNKRSIPEVINIFRQANAVDKHSARLLEELIPRPAKRNIIQRMYAPRDYRLSALITLMNANVVQKTADKRLFLSEKELATSKWKGN